MKSNCYDNSNMIKLQIRSIRYLWTNPNYRDALYLFVTCYNISKSKAQEIRCIKNIDKYRVNAHKIKQNIISKF